MDIVRRKLMLVTIGLNLLCSTLILDSLIINPKTAWKAVKRFRRMNRSSLPWCCALTWRGGLCALITLRALMAGAYAPSRFNHARFVLGERGQTKQHPGPPGWGFSAGLTTLPCKTPRVKPH